MSAAQTSLSAHASGPEDPPQAPTGHGDDEGGFFQRNKLKVLLILLDTVSIGLSYFIVLFAGTYVRDKVYDQGVSFFRYLKDQK